MKKLDSIATTPYTLLKGLLWISCLASVFTLLVNNHLYQVDAFLWGNTRVCFNSLSSSFQSECVFCNKFLYSQTLQTCTGQMTLPSNVSQEQAFCIATTCIQQTWKNPIVLGRKKRSLQQLYRPSALMGGTNPLTKSALTNGTIALRLPYIPGLARLQPQAPLTLAWNYTNRNLQWRIGREPAASAAPAPAPSPAAAPKPAAAAAPAAAAKPASAPPTGAAPPKS